MIDPTFHLGIAGDADLVLEVGVCWHVVMICLPLPAKTPLECSESTGVGERPEEFPDGWSRQPLES